MRSKYCIVGARLLISYQTSIPKYKKHTGNTKCSFFGFDYTDGIDYIKCLIEEIIKGVRNVENDLNKYYSRFKKDLMNLFEATIGPTVWELEGPIPILNKSNILIKLLDIQIIK